MSTNFRYALGAMVVLVTSAPLVLDDLQYEKDEAERAKQPKQDEGDDFAQGARIGFGIVETGDVIGRSEFLKNGQPEEGEYLVRYRAGDGHQVEEWFVPDALTTFEEIQTRFEADLAAAEEAAAAPSEPNQPAEPAPDGR